MGRRGRVKSPRRVPIIDLMSIKAAAPFARTPERKAAEGQQGQEPFLLVLATRHEIASEERLKLLDWGSLVIANHAPQGSRLVPSPACHACLLFLSGGTRSEATDAGRAFVEQLNKLPVYRVAPGNGCTLEVLTQSEDAERFAAFNRSRDPAPGPPQPKDGDSSASVALPPVAPR